MGKLEYTEQWKCPLHAVFCSQFSSVSCVLGITESNIKITKAKNKQNKNETTLKRRHWRCSSIFIVISEYILPIVLLLPLLTLNKYVPPGISRRKNTCSKTAWRTLTLDLLLVACLFINVWYIKKINLTRSVNIFFWF